MKVAIAQLESDIRDLDGCVDAIIAASVRAAQEKVDMLVFPTTVFGGLEAADSASSSEYLFNFLISDERIINEIACLCLVPIPLRFESSIQFETLFIQREEIMPVRLVGLSEVISRNISVDLFASEPILTSFGGHAVAIAFSERDLEFILTVDNNIDLLLYLPEDGYGVDSTYSLLARGVAEGMLIDLAKKFNTWVVGVSGVGIYSDMIYTGGSFVLSPDGQFVSACPSFETSFTCIDIDFSQREPHKEPVSIVPHSRPSYLWRALATYGRLYMQRHGLEDVLVQLNGSLASSVICALAVDALGSEHVSAVIATQDEVKLSDAQFVANSLGIEAHTFGSDTFDTVRSLIGVGHITPELVAQFVSAALLGRQNCVEWLAWDKTALALGQSTDFLSSRSIALFGDIYRSEIHALAEYRNSVSLVIPESALNRLALPSFEGLSSVDGTDISRLHLLDTFLFFHIERHMSLMEIMSEQNNRKALAEAVVMAMREVETSHGVIPVCPVLSNCPLTEHSWPVGIAWYDYECDESTSMFQILERTASRVMARSLEKSANKLAKRNMEPAGPGDMFKFLRDFAQGGGFSSANDVWGDGLFSDN